MTNAPESESASTIRPTKRLWLFMVWCLLAVVLLGYLLPFERYHGHDIFSFLLIWVWWSGPAVLLAALVTILLFRWDAAPFLRVLAAAHLGGSLALSSLLIYLQSRHQANEVGFYVGFVTALGFLATVPALLLSPRSSNFKKGPRPFFVFMGAAAVVIGAAALWGELNISIVEGRIRALAGELAYCLQVTDGEGGYRRVTSRSDFNGLSMQSPYLGKGGSEDYQWSFHLLLITDRDYNWSYLAQDFQIVTPEAKDALYLPQVCRPMPDFLDNL